MPNNKSKPMTIKEYIDNAPKEVRQKLLAMQKCIRQVSPGAIEGIKWGMPAFSYTRILVAFAVFKHHIGFYPTPSAIERFSTELLKYKTSKGAIQFPLDKPLPIALIKKITRFRVNELINKDKTWR